MGTRVQLKCAGSRWRTGGEVKGKMANGVGSQYSSVPRNMVYLALIPLMRTTRLPVVDWTDNPTNLNGLVRFAERRNLVSAHVPSHFKRSLQTDNKTPVCAVLWHTKRLWNLSTNLRKPFTMTGRFETCSAQCKNYNKLCCIIRK